MLVVLCLAGAFAAAGALGWAVFRLSLWRGSFLGPDRLLGFLLIPLFLVAGAPAYAAPSSQRVVLVRLGEAPELIREATRFAYGELVAAGFEVTVARVSRDSEKLPLAGVASLSLDTAPGGVRIQVVAPDGETRFDATIAEAQAPSADVIAVRAVEALRATLLRYEKGELDDTDSSDGTATATAAPSAPAPAAPALQGPTPEPPVLVAPPPPSSRPHKTTAHLGAGVGVAGLRGLGEGLLSVRLGAQWRHSAFGLGVHAETAAYERALVVEPGRIFVDRSAVLGGVHWWFRDAALDPFVFLRGGLAWYELTAIAEQGYEAKDASHVTGLVSLGAGVTYSLSDNWLLAGELSLRFAQDAWTIRAAGRDLVTLEQPSVGVSGALWFSVL